MLVADCQVPTVAFKLNQRASFHITEVCADHKLKPVLQLLQDDESSFTTNLANAQEHIPEAEHNNCILKEQSCTTYCGIPYKQLPHTVICYVVMETEVKLIYFPT